jgi:hypothetical protein
MQELPFFLLLLKAGRKTRLPLFFFFKKMQHVTASYLSVVRNFASQQLALSVAQGFFYLYWHCGNPIRSLSHFTVG